MSVGVSLVVANVVAADVENAKNQHAIRETYMEQLIAFENR